MGGSNKPERDPANVVAAVAVAVTTVLIAGSVYQSFRVHQGEVVEEAMRQRQRQEAMRNTPNYGYTTRAMFEERTRLREWARAKREREMDRAYEEYLAGFPECEAFVEGALLNDLCEPRPLSRKAWERRGRAREPVDPVVDDPLRGLDGL